MPSGDGGVSSDGGRRDCKSEAERGAAEKGALDEPQARGGTGHGARLVWRGYGK
jgi:hypothetical protein